MTTDARYAALVGALGLTVKDLAEIGGFSHRVARDLMVGRRPFRRDIINALDRMDDDCKILVDEIVADVHAGSGAIWIFRTNADLRAQFPEWSRYGCAKGGFVGPHRISALIAAGKLYTQGIEVELHFFDSSKEHGPQNLNDWV